MANETYTLIQKTTLTAAASSITLSNIPQTFTDLVIKTSARTTYASPYGEGIYLSFNGLNTNMTRRRLYGLGSGTPGSDNAANSYAAYTSAASQTANVFGNSQIYISEYTSSNYKFSYADGVAENNVGTAAMMLTANTWSSSAAITSITLTPETGSNFVEYTTVSLYGVAKYGVNPVAGPKATGGDIITNDGTYWIHQFLNSGTFIPSQTLSAQYLVVAGGGSGGGYGGGYSNHGGGGGAGGLRSTVTATGGGGTLENPLSVTAQAYTITVGAGASIVANGSSSTFSTISAAGGGAGGYDTGFPNYVASVVGGSGGGGARNRAGANGTTNQGYGGSAGGGSYSGSGGGAGAIGGTGDGNTGGDGGAGVATSITGTSVTRAGGGAGGGVSAGGNGGTGGGGAGTADGTAGAGTANTGGGGGGAYGTGAGPAGANGGSGIVIIRYAI